MERLTFDGNFCDIAKCGEINGGSSCKDGYCSQRKVWERLKQYEDAEAEGRLVVLPCKEGTKVYKISYRLNGNHEIYETWFNLTYIKPNDFGKTVFLTKEEAEQALKGDADVF